MAASGFEEAAPWLRADEAVDGEAVPCLPSADGLIGLRAEISVGVDGAADVQVEEGLHGLDVAEGAGRAGA